jgi:catecholate siderophore receptor
MKRPLCGPKLISSLFAASLASTAFAGEGAGEYPAPSAPSAPAVPAKEETALPEVVVTGEKGYNPGTSALHRNTQPLRNTPQSITVVPRQLIDDQGVTTMRDVLRNVSGISIAAGEAGAQGDSLTIRGFSARSDFFLDGMRDFGSYYRDPFDVDQIEVLEGPASVMFGRGSTGGAVNQVSKLPLAGPLSEATFAIGSDNTRRATADISRPLDLPGAGFRINVMGQNGGVAGRNVAQNTRFGFAPSMTFGAGTPNRLTLTYLHETENDVPDYGVPWMFGAPAPGVDRRSFYGFPNDYLKTVADIVTAKGERDVNERVTLRDQIRFANYDRDARITEPQVPNTVTPSTPLGAVTVNRNEITTKSTEGTLQNQADVLFKLQTGPVRHDVVAGIETDHETSNPTRTTYTGVPATTLLDPNEGSQFTGTGAVSSKVQATVDSLAFYGLDTMHFGEKWDLIGGARWDHVASYYSQSVAPAASFSRTDRIASWRGALVFKPRTNGSVYASAGTSFNPSADQLALSAATSGLPPEKTRSYEVGTKWDLADGRLTADAAVFRDEKTNARETDPNNAALNILSGDQRVDGFSIGLRGAITDMWQAFAGYTFLRGRVISSVTPGVAGRPLGNTPKNTLAAWTTYKLPMDFQVGGGVDVVSARAGGTTVSTGATAETGYVAQAPGYAVFNAMVKRQMSKKVSVQLSVANLADTFYYDGIHPGHVIPGAGRTFTLTTDWKF